MKMTRFAGVLVLAPLSWAPVTAQTTHAVQSDAATGSAVEVRAVTLPADGSKASISIGTTGVAITGSTTSASATLAAGPISSSCAFASGSATCGPFVPWSGTPIHLMLQGGATFTATLGSSQNNCATVYPVTAGGIAIAYSASVNEYVVQPPTTGAFVYCLQMKVTSGTETFAVRQ